MAKSKFIFSTGLESREGKLSFDDSTGNLTLTGSTVFSGSVKAHYTPSADEDLVTVEYLNSQISANDQLGELNDVTLSSVDDGHMLVYNTDVWENVAMSGDATMAANGQITISSEAVTNDMLEGSIANAKLANSAITVTAGDGLSGGGSVSLGGTVSLAIGVDNSSIEINGSDQLQIMADGVVTSMIADSNVTTAKIADLAVTTAKLSGSSVTSAKLAADAVETAKILDANVTRAKIANDAINGDKIADDAIASEHLAADAVETASILDANVTRAKIANDAINGDKIADDAVASEHIADGAVLRAAIADDAVNADKLADTAVTAGAYGAATGSVSLTVDAQGRLTAASHQDLSVSHLDTDDLSEGSSNLYFTDARAQGAFSGGTGVTISNGTASIGQDVATDSDVQFADITAVSGTLSGDLTISGDLTVNGDTVTVSTTNMVVEDSLIELSNGLTGAAANDAGFIIERGTTGDNAAFIWDESADRFMMGTTTATGESTGDLSVDVGTLNANLVGNVTGDVVGDVTGTVSDISNHDTDALSEGSSNLYFTNARADGRFDVKMAAADTDDLNEGSNLYFTNARADGRFDVKMAAADTGDLSEGSNLYFTSGRAREAISVNDISGDGSLTYNSASGVISYTGPSAAEVRAHFDAENGVSLSSGTSSLDLNSLSATAVSNTSDSFAFIDGDDNSTKKATLASVISGSAGTGLVFDAATATLKLDTSGEGAVGEIVGTANEISVAAVAGTDRVQIGLADNVAVSGTLSAGGNASLSGDLTVAGDLFVQGTTVSVDSTEVKIIDRTLVIGSGSSDAQVAAAGGAGLKIGSEDAALASILYDGSDSFDVTDHMNLASGNEFKINDASILSADTLGSSVVNSSLTSVGTITSGEWNGTAIANAYLADNAVSTAKIQDLAVTTAKLSGSSVTNAKLADDAVSTDKIQASAVTNAKLANDSVTVSAGSALSTTAAEIDLGQSATLSVNVDGSSIEVNGSDALQIKASGVTNAMLSGSIANDKLANSTISGVALGGTLGQLSKATNSGLAMSDYDGSAAVSDLAIDMNDLAAAEVNVANDSIAIIDADDSNGSRKESISDLMSAVAGSGLAASNGVLSLDPSSGAVQTINGTANEVEVSRTDATVTIGLPDDVTLAGDLTAVSASLSGDLTVSGDLLVSGETVTVNASEVVIEDKTLVVASGASDAEIATANGAGLKIGNESSPLASILYDGSDSFDVTDHMNLSSGNEFKINDVSILSADTLGSSVVNSSLTSVGTISTGVWNGTAIAHDYIADDAVDGDKLADTSVSAGTYGDANKTTTFAVDAQGRLTSASQQNLSISHLDTGNLAEGSNLYYTTARWDEKMALADTDDLSEGSSNLYFTDARADGRFDVKMAAADTDDLSEGSSNLYYTTARWDEKMALADTDDLSEGSSNLYFTDARAQAAFSGGTGVTIASGTASIGQAVATTDDVSFNKVTVSGSAGSHEISMHQASMIVKEVASMTSGSVVDSFDASNGGSAEYLISAKDASGNMQTNKLLVASDGTSSFVVEYGDVDSSGASGFIEFTSDVSGGNARLLINSNSSGGAVTVRFHKVEVLY